MTISAEERAEMMKFRQIMDQGGAVSSATPSGPNDVIEASMTSSTADVQAMKTILERFHGVDAPVVNERKGPTVREAMVREPTQSRPTASVVLDENGKTYSVMVASYPLARGVVLKETAVGLSKMINRGKPINDRNVVRLLAADQQFNAAASKMRQRALSESEIKKARQVAIKHKQMIIEMAE